MRHLPEHELLKMIDEEPELTIGEYVAFMKELDSDPVEIVKEETLQTVVKAYISTEKTPAREIQIYPMRCKQKHRVFVSRYNSQKKQEILDLLKHIPRTVVAERLGISVRALRYYMKSWQKEGYIIPPYNRGIATRYKKQQAA